MAGDANNIVQEAVDIAIGERGEIGCKSLLTWTANQWWMSGAA